MAECVNITLTPFVSLSEKCIEPGELIGVVSIDITDPALDLNAALGDWYIGADWNDATKWATLITSGAITIIGKKKRIEGTKPKSSAVTVEFAGKNIEVTRDHTGEFKHQGVDANIAFWTQMNRSTGHCCGFVFRDGVMAIPVVQTRDNTGVVVSSTLQSVNWDADWDSEGGRQGLRLFNVAVDWENPDLMIFKKIPVSLFE